MFRNAPHKKKSASAIRLRLRLPAEDVYLDVPERGKRIQRNPGDALLFSKKPSSSFTCPVYSTDTWDLGLKSHPNDLVQRGIELKTLCLTV